MVGVHGSGGRDYPYIGAFSKGPSDGPHSPGCRETTRCLWHSSGHHWHCRAVLGADIALPALVVPAAWQAPD